MNIQMNDEICGVLEEGIAVAKNALHLVDAEVGKSGDKARAFDKMFVAKAIQECEAVTCLLRANLRFPATAHLRTLTNVCATIRKLRDGDPAANYVLFLNSAIVEASRVLKASERTGYRVTLLDTSAGMAELLQEIEVEYGHRFRRVDSWVDDPGWQKTVLMSDDWLSFVYQCLQWYHKIQHASSLGLALEGIANHSLFMRTDDGNDKDRVWDRIVRLTDWLTHPATIGIMAYRLLSDTMKTATNNQGGIVNQQMENVEIRLNQIWKDTKFRNIDDVTFLPKSHG